LFSTGVCGIINANVLIKNMRNKKTFRYALVIGAITPIFVFSLAFAQVDRPDRSVEQQRGNTRSMDKMDREGEESEERQIKNTEFARRKMMAVGIARMMGNQVTRAERAIARLDQIMVRVQSRYDKLDDQDVDLSKVDPLMDKAKQQKTEAVAAITKAKANWDAFKAAAEDEDGDPRVAGKVFIESMKDVNKKLIAFHKTLHETVQAMKRAAPKPEGNQ
jgi:hypothetical protein